MKRLFASIFAFTAISTSLFAEKLTVGVLNGPSAIPCANVIENKASFSPGELEFHQFAGADMELPKLIKGEIDLGILPPNVAAKVYNQTKGALVCLAVVGNGNLYLLTSDKNYVSLESLKGKNILCAGQGATPEYMFRYLLGKNNIYIAKNPASANLDFSIPNAEIATQLILNKAKYALVPEPFATVATTKSNKIQRVLNLSDEYARLTGTRNFPMTVLVANKASLESKKQAIDSFLETYRQAVEWTNENPVFSGNLVEKHRLGLKAAIAAKSIPKAAYTFSNARDSKSEIEKLLSIFLEAAPVSVGGKLPDEAFYYSK